MLRSRFKLWSLGVASSMVFVAGAFADDEAERDGATAATVLYQPSMNVFRRFDTDAEKMYAFYRDVLGFEQLETYGAVARFQGGASEVKLTPRVPRKTYQEGGVADATGLRLLTFFFADEAALAERFERHGYPAPEFAVLPGSDRRAALVTDPDGQAVELVVVPGADEATLNRIEVGLTVSALEESRAFYRSFVGLEELPPAADPLFGTTKYGFRHGSTTINLRSVGAGLPADTGSGGIQYVVSDVDHVAALAEQRDVPVDQPLTAAPDAPLRTIWLDDPDGITNYFAETSWSRSQTRAATE